MTETGDVLKVLGMNVTRDRNMKRPETLPGGHRRGCWHKECNPAVTQEAGPELWLKQPEKRLQNEESKRRYQSVVDAAMNVAHGSRYDIRRAVNQLG